MERQLRMIFGNVELISENEVRPQLIRYVQETKRTVITLDQAYYPLGASLDMTRAVHADGTDAGLTHRGGSLPVVEQVRRLARELQGDVTLVDDVIFTGGFVARDLLPLLRENGIIVRSVVAAVGIKAGIDFIAESGAEVRCVRVYADVTDEICERDFYAGVPLCGRTVLGDEDVGMPYILPFGNPQKWASIPDSHAVAFSRHCVDAAVELFSEIEKASARPMLCRDLPRKVHSLPTGDERFVEVLRAL